MIFLKISYELEEARHQELHACGWSYWKSDTKSSRKRDSSSSRSAQSSIGRLSTMETAGAHAPRPATWIGGSSRTKGFMIGTPKGLFAWTNFQPSQPISAYSSLHNTIESAETSRFIYQPNRPLLVGVYSKHRQLFCTGFYSLWVVPNR